LRVVEPPKDRKWIWYRQELGARAIALEEFNALPTEGRAGLAVVMKRFKAGETRRKDVESLGDGILELRDRVGNNRFRLLFMSWGRHWVALTAFHKKDAKTPKTDLDKARERARCWRETFGQKPND
jgi:phage-related protein